MIARLLALALLAAPVAVMALPESVPIPPAVDHDGDPEYPAVFDHWTHDQYRCYACHPAVFPQSRMGFTHDQMDEGLFCGTCHDGKAAFHPQDDDVECDLCHRPW